MRKLFTTAAAAALLNLGLGGASPAKPPKKPAEAAALRGPEGKPPSKKGKADDAKTAPEGTASKGPVGKGPIKTDAAAPVTVRGGDSLAEVAHRAGVSRETLAELNNLKPPYHLKPGQKLTLPERRYYAVQSGDTLLAVSRRVGADAKDLARLNDLASSARIRAGQKIYLPADAADTSEPEPQVKKPAKGTKAAPEKKVAIAPAKKPVVAKKLAAIEKKAAPDKMAAATERKVGETTRKPASQRPEPPTTAASASPPPAPAVALALASSKVQPSAMASLDPVTGLEPAARRPAPSPVTAGLVSAPPAASPPAPISVGPPSTAPRAGTTLPPDSTGTPSAGPSALPSPAPLGASSQMQPSSSGAVASGVTVALPAPTASAPQPMRQARQDTPPPVAAPTGRAPAPQVVRPSGFDLAPAQPAASAPRPTPQAYAPPGMAALTPPPQGRLNPRGYTELGPSSSSTSSPRASGRPSELPPQIAAIAPANRPMPIIASAPPPAALDLASLGRGRFIWPAKGQILSPFGAKGVGQKNDGLNIAMREGDPVRAAAAGQVVYAGDQVPSFGNLVLVKHDGGWVTAYAHMGRITVKNNDTIAQGQQLGIGGQTGAVVQPQLHFEVRYAASPMDKAAPLDPTLVLPR